MQRFRTILDRSMNIVCVMMVVGLMALYPLQLIRMNGVIIYVNDSYFAVTSNDGQIQSVLDIRKYDPIHSSAYSYWGNVGWTNRSHEFAIWRNWWFDWIIDHQSPEPIYVVKIPLWFLILLFATKPSWSFMAWRCRHRADDDHPLCPSCGYDLHGLASQQCPECGQVVSE